MKLNWHEPTPHSKLAAIIILLAIVPIIAFYLGMKYQDTVNTYEGLEQTGAAFLSDTPSTSHGTASTSSDSFVEVVHLGE